MTVSADRIRDLVIEACALLGAPSGSQREALCRLREDLLACAGEVDDPSVYDDACDVVADIDAWLDSPPAPRRRAA